jgi:hypothetical protein
MSKDNIEDNIIEDIIEETIEDIENPPKTKHRRNPQRLYV